MIKIGSVALLYDGVRGWCQVTIDPAAADLGIRPARWKRPRTLGMMVGTAEGADVLANLLMAEAKGLATQVRVAWADDLLQGDPRPLGRYAFRRVLEEGAGPRRPADRNGA